MAKRKTKRASSGLPKEFNPIDMLQSQLPKSVVQKIAKAYNTNPGSFARCMKAVQGKVKSPGAVCAASERKRGLMNRGKKRKNAGRKNPEGAAVDRYRYFHGRDPEVVTEVEKQMHEHSVLSGIGKLEKLGIKSVNGGKVVLGGFKGALLAQNEKGTQMFIEGGDQKIDLSAFGIRDPHEMEVLGELTDIWYHTTKDHLDPKDGGTATYHHRFGLNESTGKKTKQPTAVYDVVNQQLYIAGGGYALPDVGIDG